MLFGLVLFIALFLFLFVFYFYTRDDYFFIRKNITMEDLFNIIFLGIFGGVFFARLTYVVLNFDIKYLNPLIFFAVFSYAGMSLVGGVLGGFLCVIFLTKRKKIHPGRVLDYVAIALLTAIPAGFFGNYVLSESKDMIEGLIIVTSYTALFFFFTRVLFPRFMRGNLKEGSSSLLFLILFALISLLRDVIVLYRHEVLLKNDDFLYIAIFFLAAMTLIRHEMKRSSKTT